MAANELSRDNMKNHYVAAAAATILWGFTYILSTTMLPGHPMFIGAVRAIGGALPLLLLAREWPPGAFWPKLIILGTLNTGLFFGLVFIAVLNLPGGVAGTFQALGPLFSILLVWPLLGHRPTMAKILSLLIGVVGVALIVLKGGASINMLGVLAALGSAFSMALGGVLVQKWGQPMSPTGFTAWQLAIAGVELGAVSLVTNDLPSSLTGTNILGLAILAFALTAIPFLLWFKAIKGVGAARVAPFFLLTPVVAFAMDAAVRGLVPSPLQAAGVVLVIVGLVVNIYAARATSIAAKIKPSYPEQAVVD
ncbi:MAG TPA: EamA family transporter [Arsenicitalea sp.]|nr:EamA family transporter [Arsenicitalea sp.]